MYCKRSSNVQFPCVFYLVQNFPLQANADFYIWLTTCCTRAKVLEICQYLPGCRAWLLTSTQVKSPATLSSRSRKRDHFT